MDDIRNFAKSLQALIQERDDAFTRVRRLQETINTLLNRFFPFIAPSKLDDRAKKWVYFLASCGPWDSDLFFWEYGLIVLQRQSGETNSRVWPSEEIRHTAKSFEDGHEELDWLCAERMRRSPAAAHGLPVPPVQTLRSHLDLYAVNQEVLYTHMWGVKNPYYRKHEFPWGRIKEVDREAWESDPEIQRYRQRVPELRKIEEELTRFYALDSKPLDIDKITKILHPR